jgi:hypothetical protein
MSSSATRPSIKRRLLVLQLTAVAIVWLAAAAYSYFDAGHEVNELLDAHLAQSAALLVVQGQNLEEIDIEHAPQLHRYGRRVAFQVWEDGKTLRVHSANAPSERLSLKDDGFSDAVVGSRRWRVFSTWDPAHRVLVQVGEQIEARDHIAAAIGGNLLKPLLFALVVLGALTYWSVRRGLRPLGLLNREIEQRDPENLKPVAVDDCPTEVAPLVAGLNRLFARVAESIEGERRFTADAAHGPNHVRRQLPPEVMHVHVDRVALDLLAPRIEPFDELFAREHATRVEHQLMQHRELARLQFDWRTAERDLAGCWIELEPTASENRRRLAARSPHERAQARGELAQVDRLDYIVVGAAIEPLDAIFDSVARGEHEHRSRAAPRAQLLQEIEAAETRQAEVEHYGRVVVGGKGELGFDAVPRVVDVEPGLS